MKAVAFLRVSSHRQKDNTSHETQEKEMLAYAAEHGLEMFEVVRMVESAKDSSTRKLYQAGLQRALKANVKHILFYVFDRETRNLTDNEVNEKLVREGKIVIHYVKDKKCYAKDTSDSDFFLRDVQAVTNKQFIRQLRSKVMDAMVTKAKSGWFPGNKPPLGYVHQKIKDESGRDLKRGTIIVADPNKKNVYLVQREFELRAEGLSAEQIRQKIISEGLVSSLEAHRYHRSGIERRLRSRFYYGEFDWWGVTYTAKHELIIEQRILELVAESFSEKTYQRKASGHGVLGGGFIKCAECGCSVVYDPKTKFNSVTGSPKTYHYYRCSNAKRFHKSTKSIPEEVLWDGLSKSLDAIHLDEKTATDVTTLLNEEFEKILAVQKKEQDHRLNDMKELDAFEAELYTDFKKGYLDERGYLRECDKVRVKRKQITESFGRSLEELEAGFRRNVEFTFELAKEAKTLWFEQSGQERLELLKMLLSNPRLNGLSIEFDLKKPWSSVAEMSDFDAWRAKGYSILTKNVYELAIA
jgi:site-specific DNA recombinase